MKESNFVSRLTNARNSVHVSLTYKGRPVDCSDGIYPDAMVCWILTLRELLSTRSNVDHDPHLLQLYYMLMSADCHLLGNWLKEFASCIRRLPLYYSPIFECFKGTTLGGRLSSSHLTMLLEKIWNGGGTPNRRDLLTVLEYPGRLTLELPVESDLITNYRDFEEEMHNWSFDPILLNVLNQIIKDWCPFPDELSFAPKHGPGTIAGHKGKKGVTIKTGLLVRDEVLDYAFPFQLPFIERKKEKIRTSELLFVPKSLLTYRTICREPVTLQFYQQYILVNMVSQFSDDLLRHVNLEDQAVSRRMARLGSINRNFDTIDLSNASDSVHIDLVKGIFRNSPWLRYLIATRSSRVRLPDGNVIELKKFAPMGSALCFPTECLVFAAICELGYRLARRSKKDYTVYGDDIICHHSCTPYILKLLHVLHFTPNEGKSFIGNVPYRESCGGEYCEGVDCTPLRLSRSFAGLSEETILSVPGRYIDMCNKHWERGFRLIRRYLILPVLFTLPRHRLPQFCFPGSTGVFSSHPTNFHLISKIKNYAKWYLVGMEKPIPIIRERKHARSTIGQLAGACYALLQLHNREETTALLPKGSRLYRTSSYWSSGWIPEWSIDHIG